MYTNFYMTEKDIIALSSDERAEVTRLINEVPEGYFYSVRGDINPLTNKEYFSSVEIMSPEEHYNYVTSGGIWGYKQK